MKNKTINNKDIFIEIGKLLKNQREEKNLSLEDIANDLKIRKNQLESIEQGNAQDTIQGGYFVYNFIKTYSKYLDIWDNISPLLEKINILEEFKEKNTHQIHEFKNQNNNIKINGFWLKLIVFILVLVLAVIGFIFWQEKSNEEKPNEEVERDVNFNNQFNSNIETNIQDKVATSDLNKSNELVIIPKFNSELIVKDSTGEELINQLVQGGKKLSFIGIPPYEVTIGILHGTTIYRAGREVKINNNQDFNTKAVTLKVN